MNRKSLFTALLALVIGVAGPGLVLAQHNMSEMPGTAPAGAKEPGVFLRHTSSGGYMLMYRLLNWQERNTLMKGMEGHEMAGMDNTGNSTNHLVVAITDNADKTPSGIKVGFQLTDPAGKVTSTMTMGMTGGYGADVNLKAKGIYTVKTKAVIGAVTITDEFTHEVK